jgi:plasmid replication initiation protein
MQTQNNEFTNLSRKALVVKGNPLIQARYDNLSAIEYKILYSALSKISPYDGILDFISFEVKDFCNLLKIQRRGMYKHLQEACDKLLKRTITIEYQKDDWKKFSWLHIIKYKKGIIKLKFHPELKSYLLYCADNKSYTKYLLENIIDMVSKYSIRIYELTKQYSKIGTRTFTINELKLLLGISPNEYTKHDDFRKRVLNPSKIEINGLTDLNIEYEEIKKGRKIEQIKYIISKKTFDMNSNEYDLLPKLKLAAIIRKNIYDLTGEIIDFKMLSTYHRIILIELINKFNLSTFNNVLIQYPKAFFKWHLEDINSNYDIKQLFKIKLDF